MVLHSIRIAGTSRQMIVLALLACVALTACTRQEVEFVSSDADYTMSQVRQLLERVDASGLAKRATTEAPALRTSALADLRSQGAEAAKAANLVTDTFPPDTRSVPVYVEKAYFEGAPGLVVVEAWGPPDGRLDQERLWVLDATSGEVRYSAAD